MYEVIERNEALNTVRIVKVVDSPEDARKHIAWRTLGRPTSAFRAFYVLTFRPVGGQQRDEVEVFRGTFA
jgi:hypothetical protein